VHDMTTEKEKLSVQLQHLRDLYRLLATVPDSRVHDDLIDRTRSAIAAVRKTRATLATSYGTGASGEFFYS
jgi:hypothetical protein